MAWHHPGVNTRAVLVAVILLAALAAGISGAIYQARSDRHPHTVYSLGLGSHVLPGARAGDTVNCTNGVGVKATVPQHGGSASDQNRTLIGSNSTAINIRWVSGRVVVQCAS
jgi:hypothetical protein